MLRLRNEISFKEAVDFFSFQTLTAKYDQHFDPELLEKARLAIAVISFTNMLIIHKYV
jgi:hypothetical protein